jgi:hypothetical protein
MADWGAALVARLDARASLTDLLGSEGVDWGIVPQETVRPSVVLNVISDPRGDHYRGEQGMRQTRVQADCYSETSADEAYRIADEVIAAVRPDPGQDGADDTGAWSQDGVRFDRPQIEGPVDSGEQLDTLYVHGARVDLLLWHCEEEGV